MIVNELMTEEQKFVEVYWPENWLEYAEEMKEAADKLQRHRGDSYTISFNSGNNQVTEELGLSAPWLLLARTSLIFRINTP